MSQRGLPHSSSNIRVLRLHTFDLLLSVDPQTLGAVSTRNRSIGYIPLGCLKPSRVPWPPATITAATSPAAQRFLACFDCILNRPTYPVSLRTATGGCMAATSTRLCIGRFARNQLANDRPINCSNLSDQILLLSWVYLIPKLKR